MSASRRRRNQRKQEKYTRTTWLKWAETTRGQVLGKSYRWLRWRILEYAWKTIKNWDLATDPWEYCQGVQIDFWRGHQNVHNRDIWESPGINAIEFTNQHHILSLLVIQWSKTGRQYILHECSIHADSRVENRRSSWLRREECDRHQWGLRPEN